MSQDKTAWIGIISLLQNRAPKRIHQFMNHSIKWWNIIVHKQPWRTTPSWFMQQLPDGVIVRSNLQFYIWVLKQPTPKLTSIHWQAYIML